MRSLFEKRGIVVAGGRAWVGGGVEAQCYEDQVERRSLLSGYSLDELLWLFGKEKTRVSKAGLSSCQLRAGSMHCKLHRPQARLFLQGGRRFVRRVLRVLRLERAIGRKWMTTTPNV